MPHVQIIVEEPDVCFNACTAVAQSREERHTTPVVVVRVAGYRDDVPRKIRRVP